MAAENLIYDFEPEKVMFYDYKRSNYNQVYNIKDFDLEPEEFDWLKYDIARVWIDMDNSILKAELKVVTYIDLLT